MAMLAREGEGGADAIGFGIEIEQGRELRLAALPAVIDDELSSRIGRFTSYIIRTAHELTTTRARNLGAWSRIC